MDTSSPAVFVNAELLRMYVGRKVRTVVQIVRSDGGVVIGRSADEQQLVIKGCPPPLPLTTFVEVIGIADINQSINAETWTNFGDTFDTNSFNRLCTLANGDLKSLFL
ncbi:replication protein A 14 kDa subunit B-like [Telopea speciosissima]|uniref:replication protein A 14 kDa subunit B-like n=1 Tax=Telopea speciosissima TaxID=54955 RepID=UPI001CC6E39C|nr:replication protein A 14 kDa subunit B-like [Telopea speciosissima]